MADQGDQAASPGGPRGRPRSVAADDAIMGATLRLLNAEGFAGTTMAGIARAAGVSTATLYRRYSSLSELVVDALAERSDRSSVPDTGSLAGDLLHYLTALNGSLRTTRGANLLPALIGEAGRNPDLAKALYVHVNEPGRRAIVVMFERAVDRGEIAEPEDIELIIDMAVSPFYMRRLEAVRPLDDSLPSSVTRLILRSLEQPTHSSTKHSHQHAYKQPHKQAPKQPETA